MKHGQTKDRHNFPPCVCDKLHRQACVWVNNDLKIYPSFMTVMTLNKYNPHYNY